MLLGVIATICSGDSFRLMSDLTDDIFYRWEDLKNCYLIGTVYQLDIIKQAPFGLFLDLGYGDQYGYRLTGLICIGSQSLPRTYDQWPKVGETIYGKAIWYRDNLQEIAFQLCDADGNLIYRR